MSLRRRLLVGGVLALALALGACTVRPLYAPTASEAGPQADLPAIAVDPSSTRQEQVYRNALLLAFRGGGDAADARYKLVYRMSISVLGIAIERHTGVPNAYQLSGGVSFLLKDSATGQSLFGGNVTSTDSYTRSSQNFANTRANIDAEDRLAKQLAQLTAARLAAYFATH